MWKMNGRVLVVLVFVIVVSGSFVMLTSILTPVVNAVASCAPPVLAVAPELQSFSYVVTIIGTTLPGSASSVGAACSITSISISWGDGSSATLSPKLNSPSFSASHTYKSSGTYDIIVHSFQSDGKVSTNMMIESVQG